MWPPQVHWTFCNYFTWNSFQLLLFPWSALQSDPVALAPARRRQSVAQGRECVPCETWEERFRKWLYCQTKHRRNFVFLFTCNWIVASSLFLLFSCRQNIGCQFLAEIPVGLYLHDLELCTIKLHTFLFTSVLSYPAVPVWYFDPPCKGNATQLCITSIIYKFTPTFDLQLGSENTKQIQSLFSATVILQQ